MVAYSCNPRTWKVEAGGLGNQCELQLHSLGYVRFCLPKKKVQNMFSRFYSSLYMEKEQWNTVRKFCCYNLFYVKMTF